MAARTAEGPMGWTFPTGLVLAALTVWCWVMFAAISRSTTPSCELMPRIAWTFVSGASVSAFLLPFVFVRHTWLRLLCASGAALLAALAALWLTRILFPSFC
jgi:hypothetical protein